MACSTVVRWRTAFVACATLCLTPFTVQSQHIEPHARAFWISSGLLMGAAAPADEWVRSVAIRLPVDRLGGITRLVEPIGRPEYLVPALVTTYAVARGIDKRRFADATLRTAVSYAASDFVGQVLKWAVGRHRPSDGGSARRFHPWSRDPAWHSFPSGHVFQIFAIAAVAADETDRPWVGVTGYALASLTGLERIYQNDHWTSDVVAGAVIAISTGLTVDRWVRRNGLGSLIKPRQPPDP
jgi:membrane-associated phospholipid phosphatase